MKGLLLTLALATAASAQPAPVALVENGPRHARINLVVVAEGYREADLPAFEAAAGRLVDAVFATAPYDRYARFFNAYAVPVVSAEAGADRPAQGVDRDTYLGATYGCGGIQRNLCLGGDGERRLSALLRDVLPDYDVAVVLVNDAEYGGSGGRVAVVSAHAAAAELAVHEMGHTLAGLSDEYGGTAAGFASRNTATDAHADHVPWSAWLDGATPLPTPDDDAHAHVVGAFEGAAYADHGAYRPERHCRMRALGHRFCAVCTEHHIAALYDRLSPIADAWPAENEVSAGGAGRLAFRVDALVPPGQARYEWTVGGVPVGAGDALTLDAYDFPAGTSRVEVRVTDGTRDVRDPALLALLTDTRSWTVTRPAATAGEGGPGGASRLSVVAPNPVRSSARVAFRLAEGGAVRLTVFDALGRTVATVAEGVYSAGLHEAAWAPRGLAAGVYVVRLEAPDVTATRVVTVAR